MADSSHVVVKFGGTSVSTVERWDTIAGVIRTHVADGLKPLVVCSALSGVSNLLEALLEASKRGKQQDVLAKIRSKHDTLCAAMGVNLETLIGEHLDELERVAKGIELIGEVSPRTHARVLSTGELMSTRLGAAYLQKAGLDVSWLDARTALQALPDPNESERRQILSAACDYAVDQELKTRLGSMNAVLTQGFIARSATGDTVLLGRGGSDTSAAYFAAKVDAKKCEIWTDVPGMFTANPRDIRDARLLKQLGYDEAQELASAGAKVLHPRCLSPLRERSIPLDIRCTPQPNTESTQIGAVTESQPGVKAISMRKGLTLVSMDTDGMWQQVGFLANVFACFKKYGLSVDLVSTSEMNVTASLDPSANALDPAVVDELLAELGKHCNARKIGPCAAVSLVGKKIRGELHKLGSVFALFEEQEVHLLTQAASDLNLTFVVDEDQAQRLVTRLHDVLFGAQTENAQFGPTWASVFEPRTEGVGQLPWWHTRRDDLIAVAAETSPTFVYDQATLKARASELVGLKSVDQAFFAMKANGNPDILRLFERLGMGFETVSIEEVRKVLALFPSIELSRVLFTPNFAARREYEEALELGVHVTLDNLYPLEAWPELFSGASLFVRVDPGDGKGHHEHVRTAGSRSKFGVAPYEIARLRDAAEKAGATIVGLHCHSGSGIKSVHTWREHAIFLAGVAETFPSVTTLNLGGGLAVPEKSGDPRISLKDVDASLAEFKQAHPQYTLWVEPGRYPVAEAGVLLGTVTQLKEKKDVRYVGIDAGMNSLIRPALYGAYHEIFNLSGLHKQATQVVNVVGPICESADTLGHRRAFPETQGGDVVLIATAGAYGRAMSSEYNGRPPAAEILLD